MDGRVGGRQLDGRVAVITGAGSGFGRRSALLFAEHGARVVVSDLSADRTHQVVEEITAAGGTATAKVCDVSDSGQVRELVATAMDTYGDLDVMFNNAGIPLLGPFDEIPEESMRRALEVNVLGVFFGCQAAAPILRAKRVGCILNTSSAAALTALPGGVGYAITKGAVNTLTRDLAVELGPYNVRVNALCSMGGMSANMVMPSDAPIVDEDANDDAWSPEDSLYVLHTPRPPKLVDHSNVALFLASDNAAWVSGVCMPVDGATTAKAALDMSKKLSSYGTGTAAVER